MKIGGGLNGTSGSGQAGGGDNFISELASKTGGQNGSGGLGNILNFGTSTLSGNGGQGVQFGSKEALAQTSEGGNSQSADNESTITQLLNAILELLKGSEANSGKNGSGSGNGSSGTQDASGSGDIMTQLMEMIKKMLGQSSEGANGSGQSGSSSSSPQNGNGSQDQTQDSSGLAAKLGGALQMLGLGAILSALSGGTGAQGGGESK